MALLVGAGYDDSSDTFAINLLSEALSAIGGGVNVTGDSNAVLAQFAGLDPIALDWLRELTAQMATTTTRVAWSNVSSVSQTWTQV
jgi:hypothetical protein